MDQLGCLKLTDDHSVNSEKSILILGLVKSYSNLMVVCFVKF